jgi:hypothetical protein
VRSQLTNDFIDCYVRLPAEVREQARRAYRRWRANPRHAGLHFKRVHSTEPIFSVRIGLGRRALGTLVGDTMTRFWIGSHADYDEMIARMG